MMENISKESLKRLPSYLRYLTELIEKGVTSVSSNMVAEYFGFTAIQVRKDLASVSKNGGKPKTGFDIADLIFDIKEYLGYDNINEAVLVGVGKLGSAILTYKGFDVYGLKIVSAFDVNEELIGSTQGTTKVLPLEKLERIVSSMNIHIGIITTPKAVAQDVANTLVKAGALAIWNFAPTHLVLPPDIIVKNEDLSA
ncbi:MAG: redox-sensing transcriptional repressor Rex, partial [Clostridia bacterium]